MKKVVYALTNDVSTDVIYPGRFMATGLPAETPQYAFADDPDFNARLKDGSVQAGSIIVAGENFGCGSSREQAVSTLKGHELTIVAKGFARIFLQNAINLGLDLVICPQVEAGEGDELDISAREVKNITRARQFKTVPLPEPSRAIIDAGGLIAYTRQRLK